MRLYEIETALREKYAQVAANDGEIDPQLEREIDQLVRDRHGKIRGAATVIRNLRLESEMIQGQITVLENEVERLKKSKLGRVMEESRLLTYLEKTLPRGEEWNDPLLGSYKWRKSVVVDTTGVKNIRMLPERFIRHKETYEPNKIELKQAIEKEGIQVEGVKLKEEWKLRLNDE
jgi:hypothetical protein